MTISKDTKRRWTEGYETDEVVQEAGGLEAVNVK